MQTFASSTTVDVECCGHIVVVERRLLIPKSRVHFAYEAGCKWVMRRIDEGKGGNGKDRLMAKK